MKTFTTGQMMRFWMLYLISAPFAFMIRSLLEKADYQGWLSLASAYAISLGMIYFAVRVGEGQSESWLIYGERIVGKWLHRLFVAGIVYYITFLNALNVQNFSDFFGTVYLTDTPGWVVMLLFFFCTAVVARSGLTAIMYMADGFFLLVFVAIFAVIPLMLNKLNYPAAYGLLTHFDFSKWWKSTFYSTSWFAEMTLVLLILHRFRTNGRSFRSMALAGLGAFLSILVYWLMCLLLFGPKLGSHLRYPLMDMLRFVQMGEILENLDPVLISVWSTTLLIKTAGLLYIATQSLAYLLGQKDARPLTFVLAALMLGFALRLSYAPAEMIQVQGTSALRVFFISICCIPLLYFILRQSASLFKRTNKKA
ncbi:GerAB/ArcD/ProY family transporter [Paenibacillus tyrfis]|uniref:Uncharacterized protein n=1 Tax=Paenibacillus tyrfis TaxID=1501230 RepID=A0A081P1Q3_9BACL|nr:GerAB/ArcD/ProY family transporter [Paenibacillus tyrfis]KEQ24626.1 hypothetical protein ET33_07735 [Paenibacillus tyrfis]